MKLNLGAGTKILPGYVNVDSRPLPGVDIVADLEKPWPWPDNSIEEILTEDFPEHIRQVWEEPGPEELDNAIALASDAILIDNPRQMRQQMAEAIEAIATALRNPVRHYGIVHFLNEAWRVLQPEGEIECYIPTTDGRGAWQDPTHVSYWNQNMLMYFVQNGIGEKLYPELIKARFVGTSFQEFESTEPGSNIRWMRFRLAKPIGGTDAGAE